MAIKQLSVFVENKQGKLADTVKSISEAGINIRAMSIADTKDFGILRLIVSDNDKAIDMLKDDVIVTVTEVVAVKMNDKVGALSDILTVLSNENINVDYMYAFTVPNNHGAYVVLRVNDVEFAEKALKVNGHETVDAETLADL